MSPHIRNERASREILGLVGVDRDLPQGKGVAWCGDRLIATVFTFVDASHALLSLRYQGDIGVCPGCLRALRLVIDSELDGKLHPALLAPKPDPK